MYVVRHPMRLRSYRIRLPPELIDHIIDHLHNCPSALRSCALVCRAWVATSRFHLFYRIEIDIRQEIITQRYLDLYTLLQKSAGIALYIRELYLYFRLGFTTLDSEAPLVYFLPRLLVIITRLRKLKLSGIYWTNVKPAIKASICSLLALPSLVHLEMSSMTISKLEDLATFLGPTLKRLTMSYIAVVADEEVVDKDQTVEVQKRKPCPLDYLRLDAYIDAPLFVDWLLGAQTVVDMTTIRTLDVVLLCHGNAEVARLMRSLGERLENLTIRFHRSLQWEGSPLDIVDVRCNPNIQRLTFGGRFDPKMVPYLECFLSRMTPSKIRRIHFDFGTMYCDKRMIRKDWHPIGRILSRGAFGTLREVKIRLVVTNGGTKSIARRFAGHLRLLGHILNIRILKKPAK